MAVNTTPTLTITDDAIWNRLLAAFGNSPALYKDWLRKTLAAEVRDREARVILTAAQANADANNASLVGFLDGAT